MTAGVALPGNRWDLLDGRVPATPPSVTVVVVHYDQQAELDRTLHALRRQDHPAERTEVVVVDDGSPEAPHVPPGVRLVRQEDRGFRVAAARNLGASHATGEVLVFLDADTAPEPSYLRELTRLPALAPDCVTVGRRRHADLSGVPLDAPVEVVGPQRELTEPQWLREAYRRTRDLVDVDDRSYRYLIGATTACSRTLFAATGGFDEGFDAYGGEDWEWAYRAWLAGAVLAHVPAAVAWHDGPEWSQRDAASQERKNTEALRLVDLVPVPGSRGHGLPTARADVVVRPPAAAASPAQRFVSLDSVLAGLPGAVALPPEPQDDPRFDRVRIEVVLEQPVHARGTAVADAVARVADEGLGELALRDPHGRLLVRVVSRRALARERRWGGTPLFPRAEDVTADLSALTDEPDVERYVGGW
ncbi:glycosyltransferase family 2 protein [Cellulomonas sp. Marseille-Q8402]